MNPFTEPTVARPLDDAEAVWPSTDLQQNRVPRLAPGRPKVKRNAKPELSPDRPDSTRRVGRFSRSWRPCTAGPRTGRSTVFSIMSVAIMGLLIPSIAGAINVNSATQEQLQTIRGIGPKTAQIIIEERSRAGPYESFEDLSDRVKGIGPKKADTMKASGLKVEVGAVSAKSKAPGAKR